jgi:hypothetical protein
MIANEILRLPASERAKLAPARTRHHHCATADVVRASAASAGAAAPAARPRSAQHLSGFARA